MGQSTPEIWHVSKGNDALHSHDNAFYDSLLNILENVYFDVAQDIHDIVFLYLNGCSFENPLERSLKPFDVEIFEYNGLKKKVIWQHSYR